MNKDTETRHFDDYGELYAVTDYILGYASVAKLLAPLEGKRVLDYGTGTGKFARFLHQEGASVIGVDISQEMIDAATTREDGILYERIESGDLSLFPDDGFDAVVANFVLCMVEKDDDLRHIIAEIHRVLAPDGMFVILNVNWEMCAGKEFVSFTLEKPETLEPGKQVTTMLKSVPPLAQHETYRPDQVYADLLAQAGFKETAITHPTLDRVPMEDKVRVSWLSEATCPPFAIISGKKA